MSSGLRNADLVANFVADSRPANQSSRLTSYWSAVGLGR